MNNTTLACLTALLSLCGPVAAAQTSPAVTIEYYHLDGSGSVRAVTNDAGQVIRRHDYHPFGEGNPTQAGSDPLRFSAKERDAETGLDYFGARYYAGRTGRFTTVDPDHIGGALLDPQSWNAYAYAGNNPLRFIDPDGTRWFSKDGNAVWVERNADGTYTSPGDGWVELDPQAYDYRTNVAFVNGVLSRIGEDPAGRKMLAPWLPPEEGLQDTTFAFLSNLQFGAGLLRGVAVSALPGLTAKGTMLAKTMQSEAGVEQLLAGGGKVIAGVGSKELRDVARLVSQYGGKPEHWVKITSTTPGLQTHAYKNIVTGVVVELKSILPGS